MKLREHFRDLQEWNSQGIPIRSTTSDNAVKLFDSALSQYVGWYDDDIGLTATIQKMIQCDPYFILGRVLSIGMDLFSTGVTLARSAKLRMDLHQLKQIAKKKDSEIDMLESYHVKAIDLFANGNLEAAAAFWERILKEYPNDMMAVKMAHDIYFYIGDQTNMLNSIERVYPTWEKSQDPLQGYIHGMYAFAFEEQGFYSKAEEQAKLGLEKLPNDGWAAHALAHVHTMENRVQEGLKALEKTKNDWIVCNYLACHNFWHSALFYLEMEQVDEALALYESEIGPRAKKSQAMLDTVDATSLLYRLELLFPEKCVFKNKNHWEDLYEICEPHFQDHVLGFNDAHFLMTCLATNRIDKAEEILKMIDTIKTLISGVENHWIFVTEHVLQAMFDYKREQYQSVVNRLVKVKDDIKKLGGSNAQRDIFNQLLLMAAIKVKSTDLCKSLIKERTTNRGNDIVVRKLSKFLEN